MVGQTWPAPDFLLEDLSTMGIVQRRCPVQAGILPATQQGPRLLSSVDCEQAVAKRVVLQADRPGLELVSYPR